MSSLLYRRTENPGQGRQSGKVSETIWQGFIAKINVSRQFYSVAILAACFYTETVFAEDRCKAKKVYPLAEVMFVQDGDSLLLKDKTNVRIIGINAPEYNMPGGTQARRALVKRLSKGTVFLQKGKQAKDRHGRLLAHVFDEEGKSIAEYMLAQGYAFHVIVGENIYNAKCYAQAEQQARAQNKGVWGLSAHRVKEIHARNLKAGFMRLQGEVMGVKPLNSGAVRIYMGNMEEDRFYIFIPAEYVEDFGGYEHLAKIRKLTVRGWVTKDRKQKNTYRISVTSPFMLESVSYRKEKRLH